MSDFRSRSTRLAVAALDHGATRVLELTGELDVAGAPRVAKAAAHALAENHTDLLIDLCNVTFIDSMGLSVLLTIKRRVMGRGGGLRVACAPGEVTRALEVTRLNLEFELYDTRAAALAASPAG